MLAAAGSPKQFARAQLEQVWLPSQAQVEKAFLRLARDGCASAVLVAAGQLELGASQLVCRRSVS